MNVLLRQGHWLPPQNLNFPMVLTCSECIRSLHQYTCQVLDRGQSSKVLGLRGSLSAFPGSHRLLIRAKNGTEAVGSTRIAGGQLSPPCPITSPCLMANLMRAKYSSPVAVYCGSVPKMKPGYRSHSIRTGSMDSNLQLCGNRWPVEAGLSAPTLSIQMKRSYLWSGDGDELHTEIVSPQLSLEGKSDPYLDEKKSLLQTTKTTPRMIRRDQEVDSAALETARLKDKLKRKMSGGTGPGSAPLDAISSYSAPLKPAVPRSASQRLLNAMKPVPPIQRSPTPQTNGSVENGNHNGLEINNNTERLIGQPQEIVELQHVQDSLHHVRYSAEKKRKSLGGVLIPPIPKSSRTPRETIQSDLVLSVTSNTLTRHSPVLRQSVSHKSSLTENGVEENSQKALESRCQEADLTDDNDMNITDSTLDPIPLKTIFLNSAKEADVKPLPQLGKEEDGKENNSRINFIISKSAQEKMRQKHLEMGTLHQEKRRNQQLWEQIQRVEPTQEYPASITSFSLSGASTLPANTDKLRGGNTASKWVSRSSLPSIPTVTQDVGTDLRHSSAYSLPAYFQDLSEWDSDSESGGPGISPLTHPEQGLIEALKWLNNKDWEQKEKGLAHVKCLTSYHPEVLFSRIHEVSVAVTREVSNLRSKVSRHAIKTLGYLFKALKKTMDQEVEEISRVLLQKIADTNDFIREESEKSLGIMMENVSPLKAVSALISGGTSHRNSSVRKCSAKHLLTAVEQLGADKIFGCNRDNAENLLRTLVKLAQDGQQDTRFYGRRMFCVLMSHPKFEGHMERLIPSHDLRDLITTIKQKEASDNMSDAPSARSRRPLPKSNVPPPQECQPTDKGLMRPAEQEPEPQESPVPRRQPVRAAEVTEQLKELSKLLTAKEFQNKMDGVTLLLEHSKNNVKFVNTNIVQIFDSFNPRLQDANKKVSQYALESASVMIPLLKDTLHHVLLPMVTVVTDNLNSKNAGIYSAAVTVLDTLMSNIDHLWLLQPFASRIRFISGRAMSDITERLAVLVSSVYPRKPQAVERHVLPVLWYFLTNIAGNGVLPGRNGNFKDVVIKLASNLQKAMGPSLEEYASSQPQHAIKMLESLLGTKP
ncbi:TOG array regulator of axonemal microtubules protein 2 [Discoglossus pictus]